MTATAVDLTGMPQPRNEEATTLLVDDLLTSLAVGDDADVVLLTAAIRDVAGQVYTVELAARVGAVYRHRDGTA